MIHGCEVTEILNLGIGKLHLILKKNKKHK